MMQKNYQPQLVFVQDFFHHQEYVPPIIHISQQKKPAFVEPRWIPYWPEKNGQVRPKLFEDTKIAYYQMQTCEYIIYIIYRYRHRYACK